MQAKTHFFRQQMRIIFMKSVKFCSVKFKNPKNEKYDGMEFVISHFIGIYAKFCNILKGVVKLKLRSNWVKN